MFFIFNRLYNFKFKLKLLVFFKKTSSLFYPLDQKDLKKIVLQKFIFTNKKPNFYKKNFFNPDLRDNLYNTSKRFLKVVFSNRQVFKNIFFKKFTKQKKITKMLNYFGKKKNYINNNINKYLFLILLRSHFFFFINDVNFFIKNSYVVVNGLVVKNKFFEVKTGDCIQLINSKLYFDYIFKVYKYFKKKVSKIKFKRWKNFQKKKKTGLFFKTWLPNFLDKFIFYKTDIPKYLEIDFFSLSIIMLYNSKTILENDIFFTKVLNSYMIKMYNWRVK